MRDCALIHKGKNKDIYRIDDSTLCFVFSDRLSAFDVVQGEIKGRGELLARCTENFFRLFEKEGIKTAFIKRKNNKVWMKECEQLPFEFIIRNVLTGTAYKRLIQGTFALPEGMLGAEFEEFSKPFYELSTKFEVIDRYNLTDDEIFRIMKRELPKVNPELLEQARRTTEKISVLLKNVFAASGFVFVDAKFEYGIFDDELLVIDSFGPDEFRATTLKSIARARLGMGSPEFFDKEFMRTKIKQGEELGLNSLAVISLYGKELNERYEKLVMKTQETIDKIL